MYVRCISILMKLKYLYMNLQITRKLVIGYFIVILVPTFVLEWSFYQANYSAFIKNYLLNQQYSLNIAKQNFDIQLEQISSATAPFENNAILKNYLQGNYSTVAESLYNYLQYLQPLYTSTKINPYLANLTVYGYERYPMDLANRLTSIENINVDGAYIEKIKRSAPGLWRFSVDDNYAPRLDYYKMIYSTTYPYYLGIIKIKTKVPKVFNSFNSLSENDLYLYVESSGQLYTYEGNTLTISDNTLDSLYEENRNYQTVDIEALSCKIIQVNHTNSIVSYDGNRLIALLIILFLVLTVLYYMIASSITRRLKAFSQYVNDTDANNLEEFQAPLYKDEIGVMITSHNNLIERIIQLTNENFQSQIQKRDAEYYALQAQIKPHFLYNMLENIRMSAETHNDTETADMLLTLGKHMRYSLNMKTNKSTLENELYFAKNYLQMQKIRLKEKIEIAISVLTELDNVYCPRLILQPILENAIKHGYCIGQVLKIFIHVKEGTGSGNEPNILVEIIDNGNGINKETLSSINADLEQMKVDSNQHIGINNVNSRLITFYGSRDGRLYINSEPGLGTTVSFYLKRL
ncbi:sensor histidine kinase [Anaerocolumna sp. MB42-C2]|uniref:sensor histidine kinase n=1 Tax=Anaerocolumna sp. MB42-C2 TaxID=3070997 RepID=UPI0027E123B6|nr:histidine kinase [Anaerocolumna sp. MB42-C2]WMJ89055.1 histidine kinase [Anaerocolumna sp. MB42-C2]